MPYVIDSVQCGRMCRSVGSCLKLEVMSFIRRYRPVKVWVRGLPLSIVRTDVSVVRVGVVVLLTVSTMHSVLMLKVKLLLDGLLSTLIDIGNEAIDDEIVDAEIIDEDAL